MKTHDIKTFSAKGVNFNMVLVPGGTLTLGYTTEQQQPGVSKPKDETPHKVTLDSFYIGETVVTQDLWQAIMGFNRSDTQMPNAPIDLISWEECQEFVRKLSELTGRTFRLPTEAEWEYAARGSELYEDWWVFSGSDCIQNVAPVLNMNVPDDAIKYLQVKQHRPNNLGIYDMTGFVFQWCSDWYGEYSPEHQTNPQGPESGEVKVTRGGC